MLKKEYLLNEQTLERDVARVPTRNGFGEGLLEAGKLNERVVGLCADLTESTRMEAFAKWFPNRFVQVGVAEQNLAAVASGVAAMGKIPFISSYAMFSPGRNWEQIRTTICYNDQPVKIIGSHAGVSVGPDGGTHQAIEDIALMRVIPRMVVVNPCDHFEAKRATLAVVDNGKPSYVRLGREKTPVMTTEQTPFMIGKAYEMWRSDKPEVVIMGSGSVLHQALLAAQALEAGGVGSVVLNVHTIKPLDTERVAALAEECAAVVTVEEHQVMGGFGSAIAEFLVHTHPVVMEMVGVHDRFGQSGTPDELLEEYGMGVPEVISAVQRVLARKSR